MNRENFCRINFLNENRSMQDIRFNNDAFIYGVILNNKIYIIDVKVNGLKINLKIVVSIQCYRRRPQHVCLCTLLCDVECFDCNRRKPKTMYNSNLASSCSAVLYIYCLSIPVHVDDVLRYCVLISTRLCRIPTVQFNG